MKTAVIGASGFIGRRLLAAYRSSDPDVVGTGFFRQHAGLELLNMAEPNLSTLKLPQRGHKAILIAAAQANIGWCQQNPELSWKLNVTGTLSIVRQAVDAGLQPIFLSSDYVFDGRTGGYEDDAPTCPSTEYGRQKQAVEQALPSLAKNGLVLRLSKVYGVQRGDKTLLDEIASQLAAGSTVQAAHNMVFCPTLVDDLVQAILAVQRRGLTGIINICNPTPWSRFQIATQVADAMGADSSRIRMIALHDIPAMAGRPLNTSMRPRRLMHEINPHFTPLQDAIRLIAAQWIGAK